MLKRVFGVGLAAAFLVVGVQSKAEAAPSLTLHICQGIAFCTDFGPAAGFTSSGGLVSIGDYSVSASGAAFESAAFSQSATTGIQVYRSGSASADPLNVWLQAVGYTLPGGSPFAMKQRVTGTNSPGSGVGPITYRSWLDAANGGGYPGVGAAGGLLTCTLAGGTCAASDGFGTVVPSSALYSLTTRTSFRIAIGDSTLYTSGGQTDVSAVPEPASMFLLGTGLLGVGRSVRRRLRK